jgi:hypothetical protein
VRPYYLKPRWQADGELVLLSNVSTHSPRWPRAIFKCDDNSGNEFRFHPRSLGLFDSLAVSFESRDFSLSEDVQALIRHNVLSCSSDQGLLHFRIAEAWKEHIRRECPTDYFVNILSDLAILVIHAFPEPYAECLWSLLWSALRDVMKSTVLPFLSVARLEDITKLRYGDRSRNKPFVL